MRLALDIGLAGLALGVERVELLVEAMLGRLAGVDGTMTPGLYWQFGCAAVGQSKEQARAKFKESRSQFLAILSSFVFEDGFY